MANTLTEAQKRFIKLDKQKAAVKVFYEELEKASNEVAAEVGPDGFFQDPEDSVVYKVTKATGKFVKFFDIEILHTKRDDETRGSLSVKAAEEAGFEVD